MVASLPHGNEQNPAYRRARSSKPPLTRGFGLSWTSDTVRRDTDLTQQRGFTMDLTPAEEAVEVIVRLSSVPLLTLPEEQSELA